MSKIDQSAGSLSDELLDFCASESLSEQDLREIIERRQNDLISGHGFFLAACRNERVTEGIVRYLLEYFPDVATFTNEDGLSPLHYTCQNKCTTFNIIQLLIEADPDYFRQNGLHASSLFMP